MRSRNRRKKSSIFKKVLILLGMLSLLSGLGLSVLVFSQSNEQTSNENTEQKNEDTENQTEMNKDSEVLKETYTDIRLSAVGDVMVHDTQLTSAYDEETNSYDFKSAFEDIKKLISESDISIVNLETTLSGSSPYTGYPVFNAPDTIVDALKYAGFDTVITANNHSLDTDIGGLKRTVKVVKEKGLDSVGAHESNLDSRILIKEVNGIKIAIAAYTEKINGRNIQDLSEEENSTINILNKNKMISDIDDIKDLNPDLILTYLHWGEEYDDTPNSLQTSYAEMLAGEGVDIILGSHPHVIQSSKFIEVDGNKAFVAYSLGNFLSNQRKETLGEGGETSEDGVIMNIDIQKNNDTGETTIQNVDYVPTWVYRYETENGSEFDYRILPIETSLNESELTEETINRMENSYEETKKRLGLD
ncbi:CapA family protein [Marinilactibacillus psychrotolerans]|uniref:CapA family protein n=1 Tax=Marinilactibacillus psychrotolerans TaxID=191770 RepID=UPI00388833C7